LRKAKLSTYKAAIGIDYSIGNDCSATYVVKNLNTVIDHTEQNNFEQDIKNIRWFWPYVTVKDESNGYPWRNQILKNLGVEFAFNTSEDEIDFIIPIEYRKKSREDVSRYYGTFGALYDLATKEEIFYKVHRKDGSICVESDSPLNFFIKFKPQDKE
jgi:hypothetical protein